MAEIRSFFKKYETVILIAATLLFIYLVIVFSQNINFFLGNELILSLTPSQKSFSMNYGNVSRIEFGISIDNAAYCRASCSYSFSDRSSNELIDRGEFYLSPKEQYGRSYNLSVKRAGSGQDIYSFEARCRSLRSFVCWTKGNEKSRTSLVTVNYDLTETDKLLKTALKPDVTKALERLRHADILHQQLDYKYFELAHKANLNSLTKQRIGLNDAFDRIRISIENLRSLWAVEDYARLDQLFNESIFDTLNQLEAEITELDNAINSTIELHNEMLSKLSSLGKDLHGLWYFINILEDKTGLSSFGPAAMEFNKAASGLTNNTFGNYSEIAEEAGNITAQLDWMAQRTRLPAATLFFSSMYSLDFEGNLLCSLKQDCSENVSAKSILEAAENFIAEYPRAASLKDSCSELAGMEQRYDNIRNETLAAILGRNTSLPADEEFLNFTMQLKESIIRKINNSYYESLEKIKSENKTSADAIGIANGILPGNFTGIAASDYNQSADALLYLLSKANVSEQARDLLRTCKKPLPLDNISNFNFEPVNTSISYKAVSKIDVNLSDNPPVCCIFNDCRQCCNDESCKNDPKTFPVIFIHGHSFAKGNSPEFSLDSLNKLQAKLQDDGYLDAGIVSLYSKNEQFKNGVWGLSGKPITVKASYYYDAFRQEDRYIVIPTKSENIDTYALRLRDLMGIVKERTGKPRVNIIAHSMGGLVARRYMQIFGDDDLHKLVMIATPNGGIVGATSDYCGLVGENRECNDMNKNSLFINKLNDPLRQPKNARLYTIIGQGCGMPQDGDGIVLAENAKLDNAEPYFVNGTCSLLGGRLHTEILDIEKYPEVYEIIRGILAQ